MENEIITAQNIFKSYGDRENRIAILNNISLSVKKEDFVSIMGPSGCGKSTLLYILGAIETPDEGTVLWRGQNIFKMRDKEQSLVRHKNIGFVFQFYNLIPNLTVRENIILPLEMRKVKKKEYETELKHILEVTKIADKQNEYPNKLSGGQQQRVAIARALIGHPEIILADEPTGNLDSRMGDEIMGLFKQINQDYGITIVQVTHSKHAAMFGKKIIYMKDGRFENECAV